MTGDVDAAAAARDWFDRAADGLLEAAGAVRPTDLVRPGLGVWTVRDLIGHASRSFVTIETYLAAPAAPGVSRLLHTPAAYYAAALGSVAGTSPEDVAERGRAAGRALGDDPVSGLKTLAERVRALVVGTPDEAAVATPFGTMTLAGYLPTRAFELTVHGLDLCRALATSPPSGLTGTAPAALALAASLANPDQAAAALMALTGRAALPDGFNVVF